MNATTSNLDHPLYADKAKRAIPGTTAVAVTMFRSADNSIREHVVLDTVTDANLGRVYFQKGSATRSRGYAMVASPMLADEIFANLTEYAIEAGRRNGVDVSVIGRQDAA